MSFVSFASNTERRFCLIVVYYIYLRRNQNLYAYLRLRGWNYRNFRSLPADFTTVLFFTPLAALLIYYCIKGAMEDAATVQPGDFPPGGELLVNVNFL